MKTSQYIKGKSHSSLQKKQIFLEQTQLSYADVYSGEASLQTKLSRQTLFYFKRSRLDLFTRSAQELSVKAEDFYAEC